MGSVMRATKSRYRSTIVMSMNNRLSVLHFSKDEIFSNADNIGTSLGGNSREIAKSINDLLELEVDRAMEILRNIALVKPMNESEVNELGIWALECFVRIYFPPVCSKGTPWR